MQVAEFVRILDEFAKQARAGRVLTNAARGNEAALLAEQLSSRLSAPAHFVESKETISTAPGDGCPCCGR